MDQRSLVQRAQRGDHDAFAALAGALIGRLGRAASGFVWVRRLGDVARIDPRENRVIEFYGPTPGWGALGSDGTSVWVSSPDANLVWRLSP